VRILVAHSRYRSSAPSGENLVVDQESELLAHTGHDVALFERRSDDIASWRVLQRAAVPARVIRNRPVRADLLRTLRAWRPDLVHVHNVFPLLSPSVLLAARDAGVPVVATIHNYKLLCASGDFFREGQTCHACAGGRVLPGVRHGCYRESRAATLPVSLGMAANRHLWHDLVSAYIFISAAQRDLMSAMRLPSDRVFVKHNFVHEPSEPPAARRRHGITYVGRLDAAKGTLVLMTAWDAFRSARPQSRMILTVAGHGPLEDRVRAWAERDPQVDYRGLVRRDEARALVAGGLAAVVPSAWEETFGLVAAEAMAAGVAPVAPASGSFPELVKDGIDGLLYEDGAVGLARAIERVDAAPASCVQLGVQAEQTYRTRFHPKPNLDQLLAIYDSAVSRPRFASPTSPELATP
jgi:glycosyltransferase involved in cell wall biosynthesis